MAACRLLFCSIDGTPASRLMVCIVHCSQTFSFSYCLRLHVMGVTRYYHRWMLYVVIMIIISYKRKTWLRSFKVIDFGANGKCIYDFLLVINSNYSPILHRFDLLAENCIFFQPLSYLARPLPLEFHVEVHHGKSRVTGLSCGESCMILASNIFDWSTPVTNVQTSRRTDRR